MARRKSFQEESFETADGFQIEDLDGNAIEDEQPDEDDASAMSVIDDEIDQDEKRRAAFWAEDEDEAEDDFGDELFSSLAENSDWEEGYDY